MTAGLGTFLDRFVVYALSCALLIAAVVVAGEAFRQPKAPVMAVTSQAEAIAADPVGAGDVRLF